MPDSPLAGLAGVYEANAHSPEAMMSGVTWPAIIGGAFAAAAMSLILIALGSGLGLASVSPWSGTGASVTSFTAMTAVWLIVTQWLSSAVGGYLTGRLRTKWAGLHTHEVFFRDTANGFLSWAAASVIGAVVLAAAVSAAVSGTASMTAGAATGTAPSIAKPGGTAIDPAAYFVDLLYRGDRTGANAAGGPDVRAESTRILANQTRIGDLSAPDKTYLAQLVATRTGLSREDAENRVVEVSARMQAADVKTRQAADAARKAGAYFSIFTAVSMLIGAFIACVAAALGGQQRDAHQAA